MATQRDRSRSPAATSSEEWGQRLRRGDPDAVHHVRERVRRILSYRRLGIPDGEREDLEQEVMAELWRAVNRAGFDFTAGFWGFVEIVASRRCIDWLRSRKPQVPVTDALQDHRTSPFDRVLDSERAAIAARVLQQLDAECRQIIIMRLHEGLSYRIIGDLLGKSEGAVRVQMYRSIRHARRILQEIQASLRPGSGRGGSDGTP